MSLARPTHVRPPSVAMLGGGAGRSVFTAVHAALAASGLPQTLWPYAARDAVAKGNHVPKRKARR